MSERNPFTMMFDMQRTFADQQKQFVTRSFEFQRRMLESMHSGIEFQQHAEHQMRSLTESAVDATIDAMEASSPGEPSMDEVRSMIDEQLDAGEKLSDETWSAIESQLEESMEVYTTALDQSEDMYLDLFDAYLRVFDDMETTVDEAA